MHQLHYTDRPIILSSLERRLGACRQRTPSSKFRVAKIPFSMMKSFTVSMINQDGFLDPGSQIPDRFEDDFFASLFFKLVPREVKSFVDALD